MCQVERISQSEYNGTKKRIAPDLFANLGFIDKLKKRFYRQTKKIICMVKKRYSPRQRVSISKGVYYVTFNPEQLRWKGKRKHLIHSELKIVHSSSHTCTRVCIALFYVLQYSDVGEMI